MKKLLAVLVAAVMILSSISAFAAEILEKPVASFDYETGKVTVSGIAAVNEALTIYVVNPGFTAENIGENNGALQNFRKISADSAGKYNYQFKLANETEGEYKVYVKADGKAAADTSFVYAGEVSKESLINSLYGEDDSNVVKTVITDADNAKYLQISEFAPYTEADKDSLSVLLANILKDMTETGDDNKDLTTLIKTVKSASVTQLYNEGKISTVTSGTTILYEYELGIDSLDCEGKTLYTAYKTLLSDSAKLSVISSLSSKDFASADELLKTFAENVVLKGIANPKSLGYGHVTKILTSANCAFVNMEYNSINNAQATKIAALSEKSTIAELATAIKAIIDDPANSQISVGGGAGGGAGGGGGGGAVTVTPSDNSYIGNGSGDIPTPAAPKGSAYFTDLKDFEWADEAVGYLYNKGIISGTSENTFAPGANLTREQFAKVLCIIAKIEPKANDKFDDVEADSWYAPYIGALSDAGLVSGIIEGTFGVGYNITREDLCVMIYRAFSDKIPVKTTKTFADNASINEYAKDAVNALSSAGILNGFSDGTFRPQANCTRAEMAKIVYEIAQIIE